MSKPAGQDEDFQTEPVPGLPARPPEGERILWQGAPSWKALAWRVFGVRLVLLYLGAVALWRIGEQLAAGGSLGPLMPGLVMLALSCLAGAGLLAFMAWVAARATIYTITTKRVVMRIGVALTVTLNLPFRWIGSASLRTFRGGAGDLPLALTGETRLAYLMLWPHARPWAFGRAEPTLRAIKDAERVAGILAEALSKDAARRREAEDAPAPTVRPAEPVSAPATGPADLVPAE